MKLKYIDVWDRIGNLIPTLGRDFTLDIQITGDASADIKLTYLTEIGKSFVETVKPLIADQVRRLYAGAKPFGPIPDDLGKEATTNIIVIDGIGTRNPDEAPAEPPPPKPEEEKKKRSVTELQLQESMTIYSSSGTIDAYMRWVAQLVAAELNNRLLQNKDSVMAFPASGGKEWLESLRPITVKLPKTDMGLLFGPDSFVKFVDLAYEKLHEAIGKEPMFGGSLRALASIETNPDIVVDADSKCNVLLLYLGQKPETKGNQ